MTGVQTCALPICLLNKNCCRRRLCYKGKGTVCVYCDDDRDDKTSVALGALVKFLCKCHDVNTVLTESRTNRWCRGSFTGRYLELNKARNLLSHLFAPPKFVVDGGTSVKIQAFLPQGDVSPSIKSGLPQFTVCYSTGSAWSSSRSTGVSRPNIETMTRMWFLSTSISSTVPIKPSSGPSVIWTLSPTL